MTGRIKDHYATLGISPGASQKQIRRARNRLLRKYHPDMNPDLASEGVERTIAIIHAADVLLDEDSRRQYDRVYEYTFGKRPSENTAGAAGGARPKGTVNVCESCGRPNGWGRRNCMYCGSGVGERARPVRVDDITIDDLREFDEGELAVRFGCGAVLGLVISLWIGWTFLVPLVDEGVVSGYWVLPLLVIGPLIFAHFSKRWLWEAVEAKITAREE